MRGHQSSSRAPQPSGRTRRIRRDRQDQTSRCLQITYPRLLAGRTTPPPKRNRPKPQGSRRVHPQKRMPAPGPSRSGRRAPGLRGPPGSRPRTGTPRRA